MKEYLYVPISVKGLLSGKNSQNIKYCEAFNDYTKLPQDVLGSLVENEFVLKTHIEPGIHLHWSLPDGLTRGVENQTGDDFIFPNLPDRWMVSRIWTDGKKLYTKNWIIESNAVCKTMEECNKGSHTISNYDNSDAPYEYLGVSYEYGEGKDFNRHIQELKAVEPGDASYAAYYPSSRNIFGLYDDLTDTDGKELQNIKLCYCVCGWYDNLVNDPLNNIATADACMKSLGWKPPEETSFSDIHTLCHGMLLNIEWINKDFSYPTSIQSQKPSLHIGNSTAEALSSGAGNSERLLNHLIAGNHRLLDSHKSVFDAENKLHSDRFSYTYSDFSYILKPKDINDTTMNPENHPLLAELNQIKNKLLNLERRRNNVMQDVYDDWVSYVHIGKRKPTRANIKLQEEYETSVDSGINDIVGLGKDISESEKRLKSLISAINGSVSNSELTVVNGERYSMPNGIVMLIKNIKRDYTHGFDGRFSPDNTLKARTKAIGSFTIKQGGGQKDVTIQANDLISHEFKPSFKAPVSDIVKLINEAALMNTNFADVITLIITSKYKRTSNISERLFKLQTALNLGLYDYGPSSLKLSEAAGADKDFPDKVAVEYHKQPWNPLYLVWECAYYPDKDATNVLPMIKSWEKDGSDYRLAKTENIPTESRKFKGKAVITPQAAAIMSGALKKLHGDSEGAEDMMVLSQELDGINQQMIQREAKVRFRPFDNPHGNQPLAESVFNSLKDFDVDQCSFGELFAPLRAGLLKFTKVWIVDSFGQTLEIDVNSIEIAENLKYKENDVRVMLPPRVLQPSRLNFKWIDNVESQSPVYGFAVPNIMENNLHIFNESGTHLGYFQKVGDESRPVKWFMPCETGSGSGLIPDKDSVNKELYQFIYEIDELSRAKVDVLSELIKTMDISLSSINPLNASQLDPVNLLFGRPIALVKGEIGLETMQTVIKSRRLDNNMPTVDDVDISQTDFNVYIGQSNNHNDGTIGFFAGSNYKTLHLSSKRSDSLPPYFSDRNYIPLKLNEAPTRVTILADPIGEINIESLILPMTTVRIEQQLVSKILDSLFHTVFSAPFLLGGGEIRIPVPDMEGKKWSYINFSQSGEWIETEDIVSPGEADNFEETPIFADEGWLRLKERKLTEDNPKGV